MIPRTSLGGGGGGGGSSDEMDIAFSLTGDVYFAPYYTPRRIEEDKERNLTRKKSMCGGEDVNDNGHKNREIHIAGVLLHSEVETINDLLDSGEAHDLISPVFSGEVLVKSGNLEGPTGYDPTTEEYLFEYSLDVVSTGREEGGNNDGIIDDGESDVPNDIYPGPGTLQPGRF